MPDLEIDVNRLAWDATGNKSGFALHVTCPFCGTQLSEPVSPRVFAGDDLHWRVAQLLANHIRHAAPFATYGCPAINFVYRANNGNDWEGILIGTDAIWRWSEYTDSYQDENWSLSQLDAQALTDRVFHLRQEIERANETIVTLTALLARGDKQEEQCKPESV